MTPVNQPVTSICTPPAPRKAREPFVDSSPLVLACGVSDTTSPDPLIAGLQPLAIDDAVRVLDFSSAGEEE